MTDLFNDLRDFLSRRFNDRDDIPDQKILDALREWRGCPPPSIRVTYHANGSVSRRTRTSL